MILFSFNSSVMTRVFFFHIFYKKLAFFPQKLAKLVEFTLWKQKKSQFFVGKKKQNLLEKETLIMTH
jgi:hypothetical protein